MTTKLIQLDDNTLVEVEVQPDQAQPISGSFADRVDTNFDKIRPVLLRVCRPIAKVWQEINQEMNIEQAEVEVGFAFECGGDVYIVKSKATANLTVKLVLKPQKSQ